MITSRMKQTTFLLIAIFFASGLAAQKHDKHQFLSGTLSEGYPPDMSSSVERNKMTDVKTVGIKTGVDSLKVLFGSCMRGERKFYWALLTYQEKPEETLNESGKSVTRKVSTFSLFDLEKSDSAGFLTKDISFKLKDPSEKISFRVLYNPATEEVLYQWRDKNGSSNIAVVQKMDLPIQEKKLMPHFYAKALDGKTVSLNDFKGNYLVINWWATNCGPCIAEMPGLNKMVEKYQARSDVKFLAIAKDEKEKLEGFLNKKEFKYQQTLFNQEAFLLFGDSYPKHIIVNPEGLVTYYREGGSPEIYQDIGNALKSQLSED